MHFKYVYGQETGIVNADYTDYGPIMRLTSYTDYGLRALMLLAAEPGVVISAAVLAHRLGVSRNHLAKILLDLVDGGYLSSARGAAGGVSMTTDPGSIRLGDLVDYLERDQPLVECFRVDGTECCLLPQCRLRSLLRGGAEAFLIALNQNTLADLVPAGISFARRGAA
ncbi:MULTISPECIES: Rrf2 family transcriptional regulator [unclassified Acidiphilium]|uniref:RrF2 family transcriptional regulator n=1 Tax=unclassified Acidiphilium TaxID=2617493 RepID=UPI0025799AD6|nr:MULTISPECIES: Rrf2 family transcriptional regulator [unclassified Acidiphilium]